MRLFKRLRRPLGRVSVGRAVIGGAPRGAQVWRRIAAALLVAGVCLAPGQTAFAKIKEEAEPAPTKSYLLPYALVILSLGLGLMIVCRTDVRADKERKQVTEE